MTEQNTLDDRMTHNIVHYLLVGSNKLQNIPPVGVLIYFALIAWGIFRVSTTELALLFLITSLVNWGMLWLLPHIGYSYGPDRPSALALATLTGFLLLILEWLHMPLWIAGVAVVSILLVVYYSTYIEPFALGVTYQQLSVPALKSDTVPVRLLHIGDIHIERITRRERKLNALIEDLKPDVIVFSGDFVNISYTNDPLTLAHIREIIGEWSAPLGVYCVSGTHTVELLERVREFVVGLDNLCLLEDQWVTLQAATGQVNILGMITTHDLGIDREKIKALMNEAPDSDANIIVTHAPDVAPEADEVGYDLYLCGHTHGGQLRFPIIGAVFSGSQIGMRFIMGRYDLEQVTVYTSRGVGLEGMGAPRARFLCPPEIILWEIGG